MTNHLVVVTSFSVITNTKELGIYVIVVFQIGDNWKWSRPNQPKLSKHLNHLCFSISCCSSLCSNIRFWVYYCRGKRWSCSQCLFLSRRKSPSYRESFVEIWATFVSVLIGIRPAPCIEKQIDITSLVGVIYPAQHDLLKEKTVDIVNKKSTICSFIKIV